MKATLFALLVSLAAGWAAAAQSQTPCPGDLPHAATREPVEYVSGGRVVRALIYRPRLPGGAGVVLLHGARGLAADAPRFDAHAIQLASRGYHVLVPNYYDARAGQERRTGRDLRTWRRVAADGATFLAAQPGVEAGRVAGWGYCWAASCPERRRWRARRSRRLFRWRAEPMRASRGGAGGEFRCC